MSDIRQTQIFAIQDADTHVTASLSIMDGDNDTHSTHVVISAPDSFQTVVLSLADFRRLAAAVDQRAD